MKRKIEFDGQAVLCCLFLFLVLCVAYGPVILDLIQRMCGHALEA